MARYYALIPAAGSGARMGESMPKQYLSLGGRPLIAHAVRTLARHPMISRVFVVLAPGDGYWSALGLDAVEAKVTVLRCGGGTRADSVLNGLQAMAGDVGGDDWVLVHDAARPCLTAHAVDTLIAELAEDAVGGLLAVPVADTLKRADEAGRVGRTEAREGLWRAQTPQMFRSALLRRALEQAGRSPTDEAQAVERLGLSPKLVRGDENNFKVTYPADLRLAELILKEQLPSEEQP